MNDQQLVAVLIPIYNPVLSDTDRISLIQTYKILAKYPLIVIHPEGMDISALSNEFPKLQFKAFNPNYFKNVVGYNKLMLSLNFYKAFLDYEYILIDQLDVYIFKDELEYWCHKGYDYIGAPWIRRKVYSRPVIKQVIKTYTSIIHLTGKHSRHDRYGKVGNGGLSLRKVQSHIDTLNDIPQTVHIYSEEKNRKHLFNEDTFWAMEPKNFKYPPIEEALLFSYNKYPELSYKLTGGKTPFGCHGWTKATYNKFWCKNSQVPTMPTSFE